MEFNLFCFVPILQRDIQTDSSNGKRSAEDVSDATGFVVIEDPHAKRLKSAADNENQLGSGALVAELTKVEAAVPEVVWSRSSLPNLGMLLTELKTEADKNSCVYMFKIDTNTYLF